MGVGLRHRRPRVCDGSKKDGSAARYSPEQVQASRQKWGTRKLAHSLSRPSDSDDDILAWRVVSDKYTSGDSEQIINLTVIVG
ncbi:unnamed protein product [Amoebophrya sp. A25]|nr:unnamed protein product [Amoebophrya sp. A25]|eukprot:GSA25T00000630001.1